MSLLGSIFFGTPGVHKFMDVTIKFQNELNKSVVYKNENDSNENTENKSVVGLDGAGIISTLAKLCINNRAFNVITQSRPHKIVHEMGHAKIGQILFCHTKTNLKQVIVVDPKTAATYNIAHSEKSLDWDNLYALDDEARLKLKEEGIDESNWRYTVRLLSGPFTNIAFSTIQIAAVAAFRNYLPLPVSLALAGGSATWVAGELLYAYSSVSQNTDGDFGQIAKKNGPLHLSLASAVLVSEVALGALGVYHIL